MYIKLYNKAKTKYFTNKRDDFNIFDIVIEQVRNELTNDFDESVVNGNQING